MSSSASGVLSSSSSSSSTDKTFTNSDDYWNSVDKQNGNNGQTYACANDANNVYIYATSSWWIPNNGYTVKIGEKTYDLSLSENVSNLSDGQTKTVQVESNGTSAIVGTAVITVTGSTYTIKMNVSFSDLGAASAVKTVVFSNNQLGGPDATSENIDLSTAFNSAAVSDESGDTINTNLSSALQGSGAISQALGQSSTDDANTETSLAENNNASGKLDIKIDGDYDDWANLTKSNLYSNGDTYNHKEGALVADSKSIYFYLNMAPDTSEVHQGGYYRVQPGNYQLNVGGKTFTVNLVYPGTETAIDVDSIKSGDNVTADIWVYDNSDGSYYKVAGGQAEIYQKLMDSTGDASQQLEFDIPISGLQGLSDTSDQTIKISHGAIWDGTLETTGGSTGPVVLAGAGFVIASMSVIKMTGLTGDKLKKKRYTVTKP
ncbi:Firmicu-CTERM sorting domain-containing protein [Paucilactobacillus vaccinostercus]|uniref:Firmicu-CTERM sorting domain-containing protein n=1 Tax=Paucilactobacillus vaccinostercus TaxID=176291 RepID=UPI000708AB79|nr:Firmicu-CTERM sorting domain-containing protein [Paucilactobacillus vaccinostercus]